VFITISAPANLVQNKLPNFIVSGKLINGSAWHQNYGVINWQFNPIKLLTGSLAFNVNLTKSNTNLNTEVVVNIFNNKKIRNTSGVVDISYLRQFSNKIPEFVLTNINIKQLDADISELGKIPTTIQANITLQDLKVMGEALGSYTANISLEENNLNAELNNTQNSAFNVDIKANLVENDLIAKGKISGNTPNANNLLQTLNIKQDIDYKFDLTKFK
jgi:hypothetical protein